jgi:hypothetical protein
MTYATAIAITDILDATPQKVYDLLKDAKAYPSWTNNRLVFLPPSLRQGAVFLLLTRIGMLPPAPVPCKVGRRVQWDFNRRCAVLPASQGLHPTRRAVAPTRLLLCCVRALRPAPPPPLAPAVSLPPPQGACNACTLLPPLMARCIGHVPAGSDQQV